MAIGTAPALVTVSSAVTVACVESQLELESMKIISSELGSCWARSITSVTMSTANGLASLTTTFMPKKKQTSVNKVSLKPWISLVFNLIFILVNFLQVYPIYLVNIRFNHKECHLNNAQLQIDT
jgi:hypothetical protein